MRTKLKYLYALAAILVLCGCEDSKSADTESDGVHIPGGQQIQILHFHGHSYVCYRFYEKEYSYIRDVGFSYGGASIVHDPDCKCGKGGGK